MNVERQLTQGAVLIALTLAILSGCFSESAPGDRCRPGESSVVCCLKEHPGNYTRCLGIPPEELAAVVALGAVATQPHDGRAPDPMEGPLHPRLQEQIEEELVECARQADKAVNRRRVGSKGPDEEFCARVYTIDKDGEVVTWAMRLGTEKHRAAEKCLEEVLGSLIPGQYELSPRYEYNPLTRRWERLSPEEVARRLEAGGDELKGTIAPDIVIRSPSGKTILLVYDLKFPCPGEGDSSWRLYRKGIHEGRDQGSVYQEALGPTPSRVTPRGVEQ